MSEAWGEQLPRFQAVCLGEGGGSAWGPTMEDMITLPKSFRLCVAVPRKLARALRLELRDKCSCAHFANLEGSFCKYAVLLAMLMDPTVT